MSVKTCSVAGTVGDGGIVLNSSGAAVVASGSLPPLGDEVDGTYISTNTSAPLDYMVRINALTSWSSGDPVSLHLRWSMDCDDHAAVDGETYMFIQYSNPTDVTGDFYIGKFGTSWISAAGLPGTYDGTVFDTVLPFIPRPSGTGGGYGVSGTTLDECLALLTSGDCWLDVNQITVFDAGLIEARVIEAFLTVGVATVVPARLLYPRTDDLGLSVGRVYPPPNTQQSGVRTGSSSPL